MARRSQSPFSILSNLPAMLGQLAPRGAHGLTVLFIDGRWLKLLQVAGGRISTLLAQPIEGMSDEEILVWLREACQQRGFEAGTVLVANPSHLTTTRLFTLPSTDPVEIRDIIELQAEKHTPYAKEEILTDFRVLETDPSGYSRVLLILSHQDIVHRALRLLEGMGWVLERVGFELDGLTNWLQLAQPEAGDGVILVAEMDAETTTLAAVKQGKPYFHRSLAMGLSFLAAHPDDGVAKLCDEFQRSIEAFEAEGFNMPITGIVLTGQAERVPELKERLQQTLELPTSALSAFAPAEAPEDAGSSGERLSQVAFASLLGLALKPSETDLTPKALKLHRSFEARAKALVTLGGQAIGILLLVSCLIVAKAIRNERYYTRLFHEDQMLSGQVHVMESSIDEIKLVQDWLDRRNRLLEAVAEMNKRTPDTIQWASITYTADGQLILKGVSEEIPKVYDFAGELRSSGQFASVEARKVTKRRVEDQNVTDFELLCSFKPTEGAETEEAPAPAKPEGSG